MPTREGETEITRDVGGNPCSPSLQFIPLSLRPLQKSVASVSFLVQTGHRGPHLAKVWPAAAAGSGGGDGEDATAQISRQ